MYKYVGHGYNRRFGLFPAFISVSPCICIRMREGFLGVCGPIQDIAVVTCSDVPPVQVYAVLREQGLVAPMYKGFYHEKSALRWAGVVYTYPVCKPGDCGGMRGDYLCVGARMMASDVIKGAGPNVCLGISVKNV